MIVSLWMSLLMPAFGQTAAPACAVPAAVVEPNDRGFAFHRKRRLDEASAAYEEALRVAPPREPDRGERALIRRHTPRLFLTASEPFPLKDFAAVLHPKLPWIAYHLFWEDDIDFPDDNDPCDHEVLWVQLDEKRQRVVGYYSYFHSRIAAASPAAVEDANRNGGRPAIWVQWGKHGSMPLGWDQLETGNRRDYERLVSTGRQAQHSPLGRGWPEKFRGTWADFTRFPRLLDPVPFFETNHMEIVSYISNAVINRHFLRYNFAAKTEWPELICPPRE